MAVRICKHGREPPWLFGWFHDDLCTCRSCPIDTDRDEHHPDPVIERKLQRLGDSVLGRLAKRMKTKSVGIERES